MIFRDKKNDKIFFFVQYIFFLVTMIFMDFSIYIYFFGLNKVEEIRKNFFVCGNYVFFTLKINDFKSV